MAQHDLGSGSPEILDQPIQVTSTKDRTLFSVLINIWGLSCKMCGQSQTGKEYHRHEPGTPPPASRSNHAQPARKSPPARSKLLKPVRFPWPVIL